MELDWLSPEQTAEKWGIKKRQVQALCAQGKVDGAMKLGRSWLIPKNTPKPVDKRKKLMKND